MKAIMYKGNKRLKCDGTNGTPDMRDKKCKLVIVIHGGCVVNIYASVEQEVEIFDCDDFEWTKDSGNEEIDKATTGLKEIY